MLRHEPKLISENLGPCKKPQLLAELGNPLATSCSMAKMANAHERPATTQNN